MLASGSGSYSSSIGDSLRWDLLVEKLAFVGEIRLWDGLTGQLIGEPLRGHKDRVTSLDFSPDGSILASASLNGSIHLWNTETGETIGESLRHPLPSIRSPFIDAKITIAFSPSGSALVSAGTDGSIRWWNPHTGETIGEPLSGHEGEVSCVAFNSNGSILASAGEDNTIRLWNPSTGHMFLQWNTPIDEETGFTFHKGIRCISFSPTGSILATGGQDNTIRLWETSSGKSIGEPLRGHDNELTSVAFSPDGSVLASSSMGDKTIRLWDVSTCQAIGEPLPGHEGGVNHLTFSPDGSVLASGSDDKTIRLWHAVPLRERIDAIRARQAELESQADVKTTETVE